MFFKKAIDEEELDPWWPTCKTSAEISCPEATISPSSVCSASPANRKEILWYVSLITIEDSFNFLVGKLKGPTILIFVLEPKSNSLPALQLR